MDLESITPVILTLNEAPNIDRTLGNLGWAQRVILLDSGSTDQTLQIAGGYANVRIESRVFDTHAEQWNFAIDLAETPWVLSLDADYQVREDLVSELQSLDPEDKVAFSAGFRYLVFGKPLKRSILPPRPVLFRPRVCRYADDGHTQRLEFGGTSGELEAKLDHDDRKSLSAWLAAQDRYAKLEAAKLQHTPRQELGLADRVRKWKWVAPWLVPVICLLRCGIVLDGWRGFYYALQRGLAESLLSLRLIQGGPDD